MGQAIVNAEANAAADDLGFREVDERRVDFEARVYGRVQGSGFRVQLRSGPLVPN